MIDARRSGFLADDFMDGAHLDRRGAIRLSTALADALADRRGGGRWVALDIARAGEVEPSPRDWGSTSWREKVLLSLWMCKRFLGRGLGFEIGDPVAEVAFWAR